MTAFLFMNGMLCPADAPVIRADDAGFLHAWGAFETIRLRAGQPVARSRHRARLTATLERLGIAVDLAPVFAAIDTVADRNAIAGEGRARVTITGGADGVPTRVVQVGPMPQPLLARRSGVRCQRADAPRPLAGHKTLAWLGPKLAFAAAGAGVEPLRCAGETVLEGASSNVFCNTPDGVITPPCDGRLLPGVARGVLLDVLARLGVPCRTGRLDFATLSRHGGVVTNALLPVAPIVAVGDNPTPPVPWLAAAREVFDEVAG